MSALDEQVVLELRRLGLPTDTTQVINKSNRPTPLLASAVYRCLKRHGVSGRPKPEKQAAHQPFVMVTQPGFLHLDVKYLNKLAGRH